MTKMRNARRWHNYPSIRPPVHMSLSPFVRRRTEILLLLAAAVTLSGCRLAPAARPKVTEAVPRGQAADLFLELAEESGLRFHHFTGATGEFYFPEIMGPGVALLDYDGDGDLDVYLTQGRFLDDTKSMRAASFPPPPGWQEGNRLFRNRLIPDGQLRFEDVTPQAGVGHVGYGMGVATGDYDNDGDTDLYVTNYGPNVLFRNEGNGRFTDVTAKAGVDDPRWSTSAAFLDYDRDGLLDLFVTNYVAFTVRGNKRCQGASGKMDYCGPTAYQPLTSKLFRNLGHDRFRDVSVESGVGSKVGPGLGVSVADFNADGWPDVLVANDAAANFLWLNLRNGKFQEVGVVSGAAYNANGQAPSNMGIATGDYDADGDHDIFVTHLIREGAVLYRNDGRGNFDDVTARERLHGPSFRYTGFGTDWFDYDNDGWLDLFVANGAVAALDSLQGEDYPFHEVNQLLHHEGPKRGFRETTKDAGAALSWSEVSRGAAFGDVDNDGDVDIVVSNNNGPTRLLLNQNRNRNHWLRLKVIGSTGNRMALGARVGLHRADSPTLWRRVYTDSSYLSASDPRVHFGLGRNPGNTLIEVQWLDGARETWNGVPLDRETHLRQGSGSPVRLQIAPKNKHSAQKKA